MALNDGTVLITVHNGKVKVVAMDLGGPAQFEDSDDGTSFIIATLGAAVEHTIERALNPRAYIIEEPGFCLEEESDDEESNL